MEATRSGVLANDRPRWILLMLPAQLQLETRARLNAHVGDARTGIHLRSNLGTALLFLSRMHTPSLLIAPESTNKHLSAIWLSTKDASRNAANSSVVAALGTERKNAQHGNTLHAGEHMGRGSSTTCYLIGCWGGQLGVRVVGDPLSDRGLE